MLSVNQINEIISEYTGEKVNNPDNHRINNKKQRTYI